MVVEHGAEHATTSEVSSTGISDPAGLVSPKLRETITHHVVAMQAAAHSVCCSRR